MSKDHKAVKVDMLTLSDGAVNLCIVNTTSPADDMTSLLSNPAQEGNTVLSAILLADSFAQVPALGSCSCTPTSIPILQAPSLIWYCAGVHSCDTGEAKDAITACQLAYDGLYPRMARNCRSH